MTIKYELQAVISSCFNVDVSQITGWHKLRGGNHVYSFCVKGEKYVIRKFRPPHANTADSEKAAYAAIKPLGISDEVLYWGDGGIKIARFLEGKPLGYAERNQKEAVQILRTVHENAPVIPYPYNILGKIKEYTSFCRDPDSPRLKLLSSYSPELDAIQAKLDSMNITPVLCHGDACVISNILRLKDGSIRLIDWEYAGMADPLLDIGLAAVHQGFDNIDPFKPVEWYLRRKPAPDEIFRLKAYITLGAVELAAWLLNTYSENAFRECLARAREPYGLLDEDINRK
jgi:thiamine kinase-like enzyme